MDETIDFLGIGKMGDYIFFVLSAFLLDRQIAVVFMSNRSSIGLLEKLYFKKVSTDLSDICYTNNSVWSINF